MMIALKEKLIIDNEDDNCLSYVITYDIKQPKERERKTKKRTKIEKR